MKNFLITILIFSVLITTAWATSFGDVTCSPGDYVGKTFTYDVGITSKLVKQSNDKDFKGFWGLIYSFDLNDYVGNCSGWIENNINFIFSIEDGKMLKKENSYKQPYRITFKISEYEDYLGRTFYIARISKVTKL